MEIRSIHPVEEHVRIRTMNLLNEIEKKFNVSILFACESGSRAWGFASPDSDYDVRFIYVNRLPWYLSIENNDNNNRDVLEIPIDKELDISGWDIRKAVALLYKSNPTLLEWLQSPIIYREDDSRSKKLKELAAEFFSPNKALHHYLDMAKKNYRQHLCEENIKLKKYFYVLRSLLAVRWINAGYGMPPTQFATLANRVLDDAILFNEINRLLDIKIISRESDPSVKQPIIHEFIEEELKRNKNIVYPEDIVKDVAKLNNYLSDTIISTNYAP